MHFYLPFALLQCSFLPFKDLVLVLKLLELFENFNVMMHNVLELSLLVLVSLVDLAQIILLDSDVAERRHLLFTIFDLNWS